MLDTSLAAHMPNTPKSSHTSTPGSLCLRLAQSPSCSPYSSEKHDSTTGSRQRTAYRHSFTRAPSPPVPTRPTTHHYRSGDILTTEPHI